MIKKLIIGFKDKTKLFLAKKRRKKFSTIKISNEDVTILSNCCIGGLMYHDLNLRFLTPTINLYFSHHCFLDYVNHLKEYTQKGILVDSGKREDSNNTPIGLLICDNLPDIEIHFLHYSSFEDAKQKWIERSKRINFNKIFLVIEAKDYHEHELIDEYSSLKYKKIIFTNIRSDSKKSILNMPFYHKHPKGNITSFVGFLGRKGYDDFDFVSAIFNNNEWYS